MGSFLGSLPWGRQKEAGTVAGPNVNVSNKPVNVSVPASRNGTPLSVPSNQNPAYQNGSPVPRPQEHNSLTASQKIQFAGRQQPPPAVLPVNRAPNLPPVHPAVISGVQTIKPLSVRIAQGKPPGAAQPGHTGGPIRPKPEIKF